MPQPFALLSLFCVLTLGFSACRKGPDGPQPQLRVERLSKTVLAQNARDSLYLSLSFEDREGDIGSLTQDNLRLYDQRTNQVLATYRIPPPAPNASHTRGELTIVVYAGCCRYPDGSSCGPNPNQNNDRMRYGLVLQDQAGNESEKVETPEILLDCN